MRSLTAVGAAQRSAAGPSAALAVLVLVIGAAVAGGAAAAEVSAAGAPVELPRHELPEVTREALLRALAAYEEIRADLAADRIEGVPAAVEGLRDALDGATPEGTELPDGVRDVIGEVAAAAASLGAATDLTAARVEFAALSRPLVTLARSDPALAEGRYLFACPMVETYDRWLQPTETLENPYMGTSMLACGYAVELDAPVPSVSTVADPALDSEAASAPTGPEPEFTPGIENLVMEDVRDYKFLWREIEDLQNWERAQQITAAEYRSKAIEKTAHFLQLRGAEAQEFTTVAADEIDAVRTAFAERGRTGGNLGGLNSPFSADLRASVERLAAQLGEEPRHELFAPECKKWLLKLAFGPRENRRVAAQ